MQPEIYLATHEGYASDQYEDTAEILGLVAALGLEDVNHVRRGHAPRDRPQTDAELALQLQAEEAAALDARMRNMLLVQRLRETNEWDVPNDFDGPVIPNVPGGDQFFNAPTVISDLPSAIAFEGPQRREAPASYDTTAIAVRSRLKTTR